MNLQKALQQLGGPPTGLTTVIAGLLAGDKGAAATLSGITAATITTSINEAEERVAELTRQQNGCGSDAAYWGYAGQISYWRATHHILQAAALVGPDDIPDVPPPANAGVLMDIMAQQERYGQAVLQQAKDLAAARAEHPGEDIKVVMREINAQEIILQGFPFIAALASLKDKGMDPHAALGVMAFALGHAIAAEGVLLSEDKALKDVLPPLHRGYQMTRDMQLEDRRREAH